MSNEIELRSISQLLGLNFYIPCYQRGYRWSRQQVRDLLDDIYAFASKRNKHVKEFYCLQPVIVMERTWKQENIDVAGYELIDGQQRLTTIRILLKYFTDEYPLAKSFKRMYGKEIFNLDYQTRKETRNFLDYIEKDNDENIDFYHIGKAYQHIEDWFAEQEAKGKKFAYLCETILNTLVYDTSDLKSEGTAQVIWYELKEKTVNPIDTFIRINLGKISLTSAELIKALFLQKNNFGDGELATLKQLEIAHEWDFIENSLQDERMWWFLNNGENNTPSRISLIFDLMYRSALRDAAEPAVFKKITGSDKDVTFRYFNYLRDQHPGYDGLVFIWESIKQHFDIIKGWYDHPTWYHYIGFLINHGYKIEQIMTLSEAEDILTKANFRDKLIEQIRSVFSGLKWQKLDHIDLKEHVIDLKYGNDLAFEFLLMFNLEYIVRKSEMKTLSYKFPFDTFKRKEDENKQPISWDVEHIDSYTENNLSKRKDQIIWLENAIKDLHILKTDTVLLEEINSFRKNEIGLFEELKQQILELAGENSVSVELKNDIGNLAILDSKTNRGYGNALFVTKRHTVIENDKNGRFIPLCTKNVFLKYFDDQLGYGSQWTNGDILSYRKIMMETLHKFLPKKPTLKS